MPARDQREVSTLIGLYEPATPKSPEVRVEDLGPALALFPAGQTKPDLTGIPLADYVAADLAREAQSTPFASARIFVIGIAALVIAAVVFFVLRRGERKAE